MRGAETPGPEHGGVQAQVNIIHTHNSNRASFSIMDKKSRIKCLNKSKNIYMVLLSGWKFTTVAAFSCRGFRHRSKLNFSSVAKTSKYDACILGSIIRYLYMYIEQNPSSDVTRILFKKKLVEVNTIIVKMQGKYFSYIFVITVLTSTQDFFK